MLKTEIPAMDRLDEPCVVRMEGTASELLFDAAIVVGEIYRSPKGGQIPAQAEWFRMQMLRLVTGPSSPLWADMPGTRISVTTKKQGGCIDEQG